MLALLAAVVSFGVWAVATGGKPLVQGERLADDRVIVVADGFIAAYAVDAGECIVLVDATMDANAAAIRKTLREMGREPQDVCAILFTHGHGDHIAGARAFPAARKYVLAPDADLVEGRRTADSLLGRFREPAPTGIGVDVELADGDVVPIGDTNVEVFAVPGHTHGSAAYLINGVLFLGDSAAATATDDITGAPPVFSWDRNINSLSLHALAERLEARRDDIDTMAFGHQGPLAGLEPLLAWHDKNR